MEKVSVCLFVVVHLMHILVHCAGRLKNTALQDNLIIKIIFPTFHVSPSMSAYLTAVVDNLGVRRSHYNI